MVCNPRLRSCHLIRTVAHQCDQSVYLRGPSLLDIVEIPPAQARAALRNRSLLDQSPKDTSQHPRVRFLTCERTTLPLLDRLDRALWNVLPQLSLGIQRQKPSDRSGNTYQGIGQEDLGGN